MRVLPLPFIKLMGSDKGKDIKILSAAWLIPVLTPPLGDGSIVHDGDTILDIGKRAEILGKYPGIAEQRYDSVLMPGLINAHMHLELSQRDDIAPPSPENTFTDWIDELLKKRQDGQDRNDLVTAFSAVLADQYSAGIALVADIGNEIHPELTSRRAGWPEILRILEYLGPTRPAQLAAEEKLLNLADQYPASAHAAYSTGPELVVHINKRCRRLGHLFSIHTAESPDELEFLRFGSGCFRDFLEKRQSWDDTFSFTERGFAGAVFYFDHLDILDEKTLLVHAVHVSPVELALVAKRGAHICLCPGSNRFLRVGIAPVEEMLAAGLLPALGTDSPASNEKIDLWREMQMLAEDHPLIRRQSILAMATLGGAQALCRESELGSLSVGKKAQILHVSSADLMRCTQAAQVVDELVTGGRPKQISWVAG